jgi:hypothetical protein
MIPITLSWFVCLYLGIFLAGMLLLWGGYEVIRRYGYDSRRRDHVYCRICSSRYTDSSDADLLHCPVCGSLNERTAGKKAQTLPL